MRAAVAVICTTASLVSTCLGQLGPGEVRWRVVAYEGQPTPLGGFFWDFSSPELTTAGQPVFLALFSEDPYGGGVLTALWIETDGGLSPLAFEGQRAPGIDGGGAEGVPFESFGSMVRGGGPDAACFDAIIDYTPNEPELNETIWAAEPDLRLLAHEGDPAPSLDGLVYGGSFAHRAVSPWRPIVFAGLLRGSGVNSTNDLALFHNDGGDSVLLLREGGEFSPNYPGVHMLGISSGNFDLSGRVAMQIALGGPNVIPENDSAILMGVPGDLSLPVRRGDQAAGVEAGLNYGRIHDVSLSATGQLCFNADLNEEGMTSRAGDGIWYGAPDDLTIRVRDGMSLADSGLTVARCLDPVQNERGDIAFQAMVDPRDADPRAIVARWHDGAVLWTIAHSGQHAPGTEPDTEFTDAVPPDGPYLTESGKIAFVWSLSGPDVTDDNRAGMWAMDAWGDLELVLRGGTDIEVADGDIRTVKLIYPREGSQSGTHLNRVVSASGEATVTVEFTDGTRAVLAADLTPCPADFNQSGQVNSLDVLAFLNAWLAGDMRADFDGDGALTTLDVLWFLQAMGLEC